MSEFFKPQSPLNKDGVYFYPLTTEDQVIMDDGSRLSSTLEDIKDKVDNIDFSNLDLEGVAYVGETLDSAVAPIKTLFEDKEKTSPIFPVTKVKAVSDDNGVGLDAILDTVVYAEEYGGDVAIINVDADTLGGKTVSDFAQAPLRKSITILASGWSDSAPYTQILSVDGITVDDMPHISPVYSDDLATAMSQKEAWGMVSRAKTDDNAITFICFEEKPVADVDVQIGVYR